MIPTSQPKHKMRVSHTKSRNGCLICKRRRVKCDERHPSCSQCEKHSTICFYGERWTRSKRRDAVTQARLWSPTIFTITVKDPSPTIKVEDDDGAESKKAFIRLPPIPEKGYDELWCQKMELMHHYTSVTAGTICLRADAAHTWRVTIPQQGYGKEFVIHGILAISAAHKAVLKPEHRVSYLRMCDYHTTLGSQQFRSEIDHVRPDNWMALFSFAALITLYAFTLPSRLGHLKLSSPLADMMEVMTLLSGMKMALNPLLPRLCSSEFSPLVFGCWQKSDEDTFKTWLPSLDHTHLPVDTLKALQQLQEFLSTDLPYSCLESYQAAVEKMQHAAKLIAVSGQETEAGVVVGWLFQLPDSLLPDFQAQKNHALLLMAYFSVLVLSLEDKFWYARGWARQMFDEADAKIMGNSCFSQVMQWPREVFSRQPA